MKQLIILLFIGTFHICAGGQKNLYPIFENDRWGYIDKNGTIQIQPQFRNAGEFSEGLAQVRLNGTYGYIDGTGEFVIKPQFDYAMPFQNGLAKIFIEGKPFFIDKTGKIIFQHNFRNIALFEDHDYSIAITYGNKYCLINKKGELITDTIFSKIEDFKEGVAVVYSLKHKPYSDDFTIPVKFETGLIDTAGNWKIPYGKFKEIGNFKNGFTTAIIFDQTKEENEWTHDDAVIDMNGKIQFKVPVNKYFLSYNNEGFYNNLAAVTIYPDRKDTAQSIDINEDNDYIGVINTKGEILFSDTGWKLITPFEYNRAFVQGTDEKWRMINTAGKEVNNAVFENILFISKPNNSSAVFYNGTGWVKLATGWVQIDTSGKYLTVPKHFANVDDHHLSRAEDIIILEKDISIESDEYSFVYGFYNPITDILVNPIYHDLDFDGFNNNLIYAIKDGIIHYINLKGDVIWKGAENKKRTIKNLNIDFLNRGYFYAYSKPNKKDLGGFGRSHNFPVKIKKSDNFPKDELSLIVNPDIKDTIFKNYNAYTVFIANNFKKNIEFNAQDSRLYMKVQAKNNKGQWCDIEYLPSSWCGNSYHTLTLASKFSWKFLTPVYEGDFKTKLRIALEYLDPNDKSSNRRSQRKITLYSNEYDGSINPGQFWNKRQYYAAGIMDPYND